MSDDGLPDVVMFSTRFETWDDLVEFQQGLNELAADYGGQSVTYKTEFKASKLTVTYDRRQPNASDAFYTALKLRFAG